MVGLATIRAFIYVIEKCNRMLQPPVYAKKYEASTIMPEASYMSVYYKSSKEREKEYIWGK